MSLDFEIMSQDGLAQINGINPKVVLADGEEREVGSATSKATYKVKRTSDHYHCSCPAWRNQAAPVDVRTCKHLKSLLGDAYENARLTLKKSNDSFLKRSMSNTTAPEPIQAKSSSKRKRDTDDDVEDDKPMASKQSKTESATAPKRSAEVSQPNSDDELADFNGIRPLVFMADGEECEVGSATSQRKYIIKRTFDHYYCTCPAWRNQAGVPVNARTCKHLKSLLGDTYEEARLQFKKSGSSVGPTSKTEKPTSNTGSASKSKKAGKAADAEMGNIKQGDIYQDKREAEANQPNRDEPERGAPPADQQADELAEIDGVKPKVYLTDGAETEVKSLSSASKYKVKRTWDHYYCTCPAWRNQGGVPINARTCKHLKSLLGEAYEAARIRWKNPSGPQPTAAVSKKKGKAKQTARQGEEGGDAEITGANEASAPQLLLANKWDLNDGPDPTGWWVSEKLDGVRTYFDGKQMISRLGNPFTPPSWFLEKLPKDITLDGELFSGRGEFQSTVSIVKTVNSPHWKGITFQVFDAPSLGSQPFEARLAHLNQLFGPGGSHASDHVVVVAQEEAKSREHVMEKLKEVERLGGEGLMLREPKSLYEGTRSSTLLKVKTFYDAEAIVTGHTEGKGKNKGVTGALQCKMESGKTFSVGSGLSDKLRRNPPKVGSIIVYRFQELTRDRVPRFPTFVGISADKDKPKDAEIPEREIG